MRTTSLTHPAGALLLVVAIATIAFATTPTSVTETEHESQIPGRFIISTDIGSAPALLDTCTGDMWTLEESTNLVDARMRAWVPMERLKNAEEFERWQLRAKDKHDKFMDSMKQQALANLSKKANDLGQDHPEVLALSNEILKSDILEVTDDEVEAAVTAK